MVARMRRNSGPQNLAEVFGELRQDWDASKSGRLKRQRTVPGSGSHADYHYRSESSFLKVMEYARDMDRNDPIVGRMLDLSAQVTLMNGIEVQAASGYEELDKVLQAEWDAWCGDAEACDAAGERDFYEMQHYAYRQMLCDGDIMALLRAEDGTLQHIEAHRVRTPSGTQKNVVHGVLLNGSRRRQQYWVTREDLEPMAPLRLVNQIVPYDTRDEFGDRQIVHLYNAKRFSQTRGVSALAPVFDLCGMADDIQFAKLVQQQITSAFAIFFERTADYDGADEDGGQTGEQETRNRVDGSIEVIEGLAPGMKIKGRRGEKLSGFSPNVPNQEFFTQFRLTLQMIGVNLGLPLMYVLMDGTETNFTGWRGAAEVGKLGWRFNQQAVCSHYVSPIYRWRVRYLIATNPRIAALADAARAAGHNPVAHLCHCPVWPYIQPLQDATTDVMKLANNLVSPQEFYLGQNKDPEKVLKEIISYNAKAIKAAIDAANELNKSLPDGMAPVSWRDIWQRPTAQGINISMSGDAQQATTGGAKTNAA